MESISQLGLAFFGLTIDLAKRQQITLYKQIHQICFYGKGGYDWNTIYNLPIYLRKFIFNEIREFYEEEKRQTEKSQDPNKQGLKNPSNFKDNPNKKIIPPNFKNNIIKYL